MSLPIKRKQKREAADSKRRAFLDGLEKIEKSELSTEEKTRQAQELLHSDPDNMKFAQDELRHVQTDKANARYAPVLKAMLSLGGVGASLGQIGLSNNLRKSLVQPSIPGSPGIDPVLNQQIFNAQRGTLDAGRYASAANVGINDAYNQAVQEATNTAAGQAGTRHALINAANLRKMRASVGMLPELDAIRAREEGRADSLIGKRNEFAQENYRNQLHAVGMGLDQYNKQSAAIGALGAVGHENLFGQLGDFAENAVPATMAFTNPYRVTDAQHENYPAVKDNASAYEDSLNNALKNHGRVQPTY